jgi:hypothetical protein
MKTWYNQFFMRTTPRPLTIVGRSVGGAARSGGRRTTCDPSIATAQRFTVYTTGAGQEEANIPMTGPALSSPGK